MRLILFRRVVLQELERRLKNGSLSKDEYNEYRSKLTWSNSRKLLLELRSRPGYPVLNSLAEWVKANWVDILRALVVIVGVLSEPEEPQETDVDGSTYANPSWYGLDEH